MTPMTLEAPVTPIAPPLVEDDGRYEIVDGKRVEMPPMSAFAARIAYRLAFRITLFAEPNDLGEAITDTLFRLPLERVRNRRPDAAFVSRRRWPRDQPQAIRDNAWDVVPDLAVEVVSPTDIAEDLLEKIDEYFRAGVTLVWVVYPRVRLLQVYESLTQTRGLTVNDTLDGGSVLPGFQLPLAGLYPEATDSV